MIHGWNGDLTLEEELEAARPPVRAPRLYEPAEPNFVWRSYTIDGVRYSELGPRFITVVRLAVIGLIFLGTFVVLSKAIDRVEVRATTEAGNGTAEIETINERQRRLQEIGD